jgi:tetratricopeptide (TPR) repeat protein
MKKIIRFYFLTFFVSVPMSVFSATANDDYAGGNQLYQQGQYDQAIHSFQAAIQANPNYWQAYQVLGYCYYAQKNNLQALQAMDQSLQINPNNPPLQQFDNQVRAATPNAPLAPGSPASVVTAAPPGSTVSDLPRAGSFHLEGTIAYVYPGTQDLQDFYGGATVSGTMEAVELNLGGDFSFTPNLQADLLFEFGGKLPVNVEDFNDGDTDQWNEYYIGGAAGLNVLLPIADGMNFVLHGEGGFYTLVSTQIDVSGSDFDTVNLDASNPGWAIAAGLEFLMNSQKTWAMEIELGYRYLNFSPLTASGDINGSAITPRTLLNNDGSNASIDFSGPRLSIGARL